MEQIGEMLIPILNQMVDFVDKGITAWNNLDGGLKIAIVTLGGVLASIGPLVYLFGTLVSVVGFFMSSRFGGSCRWFSSVDSCGCLCYRQHGSV